MSKEKTEIKGQLLAGAVAEVIGQGAKDWGAGEHAACLRYLFLDAFKQLGSVRDAAVKASKDDAAKKAAKDKPDAEYLNEMLKKAFEDDPEMLYASNMKKLLIKAEELEESGGYR